MNKKIEKSISDSCLTMPLSKTPKMPNFSINYEYYDKKLNLVFWKENCNDGTGAALLVRASPIKGNPFMCSSQFKVIQDEIQFNDIRIKQSTSSNNSWCDYLFIDTTLIVDQYEFEATKFDVTKNLTIIFEDKKIDIGANTAPKPNVNGSVNGYKYVNYICENLSTGEKKLYPIQKGTSFNCDELIIKTGNKIKTSIIGIAK